MSAASINLRDDVGEVPCEIASDPAHGEGALPSPQTMSNVLLESVPGSPRETGLLVTAVSFGLAAELKKHATRGMNVQLVTGDTNEKAFASRVK